MKRLVLLSGIGLLALAGPAEAKTKFLGWVWWPSHWYNQDFQPYYEDAIGPHNAQWDDNKLSEAEWTPKDWIAMDGGKGTGLVKKFYTADIIREQYVRRGKPYVVVGPNFYTLGGADKERVMQTIDTVYNVTGRSPKMFYLEDFRTASVVGIYSKGGLDLQ